MRSAAFQCLLWLNQVWALQAWSSNVVQLIVDRRMFGQELASSLLVSSATIDANSNTPATLLPPRGSEGANDVRNELQRRMTDSVLEKLPLVASSLAASGVDNLIYPDYLAGTWSVTQTLTSVQAPMGVQFLNPDRATAERSLAEAQSKIGQPVALQLRYAPTRWGTVEDRTFNTANRLNAFAGRTVVASTEYADVRASNRDAVLRQGGTADDPLTTVFIRFKGPAAQKIFVTSHDSTNCVVGPDESQGPSSSSCGCWVASESQRSIFALTNENTAPPIFTDSEVLYEFWSPDCPSDSKEKLSQPDRVMGRLRIASYLNPMDKFYFDARNRAVSLQDYTLEMRRVPSS